MEQKDDFSKNKNIFMFNGKMKYRSKLFDV